MTAARRGLIADAVPLLGAGLLLLAIAIVLLLVGGVVAIGHPVVFDFWLLGTGLVVLLGAMVALLLQPSRRAVPAATPGARVGAAVRPPARAAEPEEAAALEVPGDATPELTPAAMLVAPAPGPEPTEEPSPGPSVVRLPLLTSTIAGQYTEREAPSEHIPTASAIWEDPGVEAGALPFSPALSAGAAGAAPTGPRAPSGGEAMLELEIGRLRERVRELESARVPLVPATPVPLGSRPVPGPRSGSGDPLGGRRRCSSCATDLAPTLTGPLCWGCGRPLCAACYWQVQSGSRAHRCPACLRGEGSASDTSRSGGRGSDR